MMIKNFKIRNFKDWNLNESQFKSLIQSEIDLKNAVKIDAAFAENYLNLFFDVNEMNGGSEEDCCIGDLVFLSAGLDGWVENEPYTLLDWYSYAGKYGEDGEDEDGEDDSLTKEEAESRIDDFLEQDKGKSLTMLYLYEVIWHEVNKEDGPARLENCRYYTDGDVWTKVAEFVKLSGKSFPSAVDMLPKWYDFIEIITLLPLDSKYAEKYKGAIAARKFGI